MSWDLAWLSMFCVLGLHFSESPKRSTVNPALPGFFSPASSCLWYETFRSRSDSAGVSLSCGRLMSAF